MTQKNSWKYVLWTLLVLALAGVINQMEIPESWLEYGEAVPTYTVKDGRIVPLTVPEGSDGNTNCEECHADR
jgi:hypothetical protein